MPRDLQTFMTAVVVVACASLTFAQPGPEPVEREAPAEPEMRDTTPTTEDDAILEAVEMLTGTFEAPEGPANDTELVWHSAPVIIDGLDNAIYFEMSRADGQWEPFAQGVMHFWRRSGELTLRMFQFDLEKTFDDAVVGLWAVPDRFPEISLDDLRPTLDMPVTQQGSKYVGKTAFAYPTTLGGAVEYTESIEFGRGQIRFADRGFDASGEQVWGPQDGEAMSFSRSIPTVEVERRAGGLVVLDIVTPDLSKEIVENGDEVGVHYSGYLRSDGSMFDSSRPRGQTFNVTLPSRVIEGWNKGLLGMTEGTRRRLIIPAAMAYGERPIRDRGGAEVIPANSDLIFEVEAMWVRKPDAPVNPDEGAKAPE